MNKQDYINLLQNNILFVIFTKKDGTKRELKCTLKPEVIDQYQQNNPKSTGIRKVPEHQVCCIDIEKNEFRSFTLDSVLSYKIL